MDLEALDKKWEGRDLEALDICFFVKGLVSLVLSVSFPP